MRNAVLTALLLVLVGVTVGAFVVTERLKLERSPITAPRFPKEFSPTCDCPTETAKLRVRFRTSDRVDALVVDRTGGAVRTLASDRPVSRGDEVFEWDGRDEAGAVVPDGRYRLQLHLEESRRTFLIPTTVRVDTKAPRVRVLAAAGTTISPDGDGVNDRVRIRYRAGSKARPTLTANGEPVVRGRARPSGRSALQWNGRIDGEPAPPGEYLLELRVRDLAGNESEPVEAATVRVRYVELAADSYVAPVGGLLRFRAVTDAFPFTWALIRADGSVVKAGRSTANAVAVRLPKDLPPGTYALLVSRSGFADEAAVLVARRSR